MTTQAGMIGTNRCIMRISQLIQTTHFSNPTKVTPLLEDVQGLGCPRGQNKCRFGPDLPGIAGRDVGGAASGFGPTVGLMPTQKTVEFRGSLRARDANRPALESRRRSPLGWRVVHRARFETLLHAAAF